MGQFILGAIVLACAVIGLFFLRFWRQTRDRFFLFFAIAFWVFGISRVLLATSGALNEGPLAVYVVRLLAFMLILIAIIDKNFPRSA